MKVLIIGGNRFFGKNLAEKLLANGDRVTLLNRSNLDDGLGNEVQRIVCDRNDTEKLATKTANWKWDLVYDQVCYNYRQAKDACDIFLDRVDQYIFTSSMSVYRPGSNLSEESFDPFSYKLNDEAAAEDYAEGKRQAEFAFFRYACFPVTAVRLPIVIGPNDPTDRLKFHIEHIRDDIPIYVPKLKAKISLTSEQYAADALFKLGRSVYSGPINVASPAPIEIGQFLRILEKELRKSVILASSSEKGDHSPYGINKNWYMNCRRSKKLGISDVEISHWLPENIHKTLLVMTKRQPAE